MQHYDVILFDVDGTLIDSAPGILNTLEEVFTKMGVDVTHVNLRRYLGDRRSARALESIFLTLQNRGSHRALSGELPRKGQP